MRTLNYECPRHLTASPAMGPRSRYAAAASKTQHSGQRRLYPIADRACPQDSKWAKKSVTPNRASVTYVLDQMCYLCPDPTVAIFSLQPLPLSLSPRSSRSACSAYPFEKNLALNLQPSSCISPPKVATSLCRSEPLVVRFAETSQQTLRHFSRLPTTYINFAEKNALK